MRVWHLLALAAVCVAMIAPVGAAVRVVYQDMVVTTSAPVVRSETAMLVPLRATAEALGGRVEWNAATKTAVVTHNGRRLEVDRRANTASLDGRELSRFAAPRAARDQLLVPLAAVERLFGVRGRWLPGQNLLRFAALSNGAPARPGGGGMNAEATAQGVRLRLTADRQSYPVGAPVRLTLTVTNPGRSPVTLEFSSGQKYDFEARQSGKVVWRWAADKAFIQSLTSLTLEPGEREVFTETWKQQDNEGKAVPAGAYEVVATLTTMGRPRPSVGPVSIRIGG